ncbi:hypothetical protein [Paenibacillus lutrae]|uniref:Uncharacterized protein n=1 Tax=Paenibacillus lutrae TaxID=2078573 RepID=A0A7X3JYK1_9BACL|nr:hypothetical protein [Paenibacillus lutrae]MVO99213.1 hypothetical protein [Paenibacillus lutrae]
MDKKTKSASIEYILSQGLVKPQTTIERIVEMLRTLGLRTIFWDTGYSLVFSAVTLAVVLVLFGFAPDDYRFSAAIAVAPLVFLLITMFAETTERTGGLYELKQTCRYTIRQITALRVICYSVLGFVFTTVITTISTDSGYEFLSLFPICLSALFLCATLSISFLRFLHGKWVNALFSAVWVFVNIVIPFSLGEKWETTLREMPIAFSVVLAVLGGAALSYQISKMMAGVKKYAIA